MPLVLNRIVYALQNILRGRHFRTASFTNDCHPATVILTHIAVLSRPATKTTSGGSASQWDRKTWQPIQGKVLMDSVCIQWLPSPFQRGIHMQHSQISFVWSRLPVAAQHASITCSTSAVGTNKAIHFVKGMRWQYLPIMPPFHPALAASLPHCQTNFKYT